MQFDCHSEPAFFATQEPLVWLASLSTAPLPDFRRSILTDLI